MCVCMCIISSAHIQEAMLTLGIVEDEQMAMFKTISGILHFGNIEVKQRPREEWATIPTTTGKGRRERGREGEREGGKEGGRDGGRERGMEGSGEGGRTRGKEGGKKEGGTF